MAGAPARTARSILGNLRVTLCWREPNIPLIKLHRALKFLRTVQEESQSRTLLLISGFIHDASFFLDNHPGGPVLLTRNSGKDTTASFFGGVYAHSHAAHNVRTMETVRFSNDANALILIDSLR